MASETQLTPEQTERLKQIQAEVTAADKRKSQIEDRVASLNPEHTRLKLVGKLAEGSATLQRPTGAQIECYSLMKTLPILGVRLRATETYMGHNFEMSPGAGGKGIDGLIKVVTPVPSTAILGSAMEEEKKPGAISKLLAFVLGSKEEKKE
jgi:hypothetical protein